MFALKRNQVVITALVVMIAVAGYLNYKDRDGTLDQVLLDDQGYFVDFLGDDDIDLDVVDVSSLQDAIIDAFDDDGVINTGDFVSDNEDKDSGEAIFVNNQNLDGFFSSAKLEREQAREKQKSILIELINNEYVEKDKKSESADAMLDIQKRIEKETAAEAMIEAKGFKEVFVRIDDDTVDVVVNKEALSEAEIAQIEDIVKRKTGMESSAIRISTIKK